MQFPKSHTEFRKVLKGITPTSSWKSSMAPLGSQSSFSKSSLAQSANMRVGKMQILKSHTEPIGDSLAIQASLTWNNIRIRHLASNWGPLGLPWSWWDWIPLYHLENKNTCIKDFLYTTFKKKHGIKDFFILLGFLFWSLVTLHISPHSRSCHILIYASFFFAILT
jgi:hypothetical protein